MDIKRKFFVFIRIKLSKGRYGWDNKYPVVTKVFLFTCLRLKHLYIFFSCRELRSEKDKIPVVNVVDNKTVTITNLKVRALKATKYFKIKISQISPSILEF